MEGFGLGNDISRTASPAPGAIRPNSSTIHRSGSPAPQASNGGIVGRSASQVTEFSAVFDASNSRAQIEWQRREHLAMGERAMGRMNAKNLHSIFQAEARSDPRLAEMRHYHAYVRDRVETFRDGNPDIYQANDPQLAHFTEAKLVHALYDGLQQAFPDAALGVACSEAAQCCFEAILQNERGTDLELMHLRRDGDRLAAGAREPDHAFVVIGRNAATDPGDFTTWNEDTVICDGLTGQVYPKSEMEARFAELQTFTQGSTRTEVLARAEGGQAPFTLR